MQPIITQTLNFERETKNTLVFKAPKGSAVDTLYVTKEAMRKFGSTPPVCLSITIEQASSEQLRKAIVA